MHLTMRDDGRRRPVPDVPDRHTRSALGLTRGGRAFTRTRRPFRVAQRKAAILGFLDDHIQAGATGPPELDQGHPRP
jgi:hypothetical protein